MTKSEQAYLLVRALRTGVDEALALAQEFGGPDVERDFDKLRQDFTRYRVEKFG